MTSQNLIRLTYASTSSSARRGGGTAVDPEIGRILQACKTNNPKREIGGVLHYGHGYFLQVLEGPENEVKALYEKIGRDPRHQDVRTLDERRVEERRFPDWSMKYVPMESDIERVLKRNRMSEFDPYRFDLDMIEQVIEVLVGSDAPDQKHDQDYGRGVGGFLKRLFRGRS
ncbi:MAG: BLUF domain-containing protein [Halofilum sp. (in: g-proteobacteria)]